MLSKQTLLYNNFVVEGRFAQNYKKIDYKNYQKMKVHIRRTPRFSYNFYNNFELCDRSMLYHAFVSDSSKFSPQI